MAFELRPYQKAAIDALRNTMKLGFRRIIMSSPTGSGKCLGFGTKVLMADGTIKEAQEIIQGDRVMGPDGKGRCVLSTTTGQDQLYRVTPIKGDPYVVNSVHLLSLKVTPGSDGLKLASGRKIDASSSHPVFVEAEDLYKSNATAKHCLKAWRPEAVDFETPETNHFIPPYILGVWLGDGRADNPEITKPKGAVSEAFAEYAMASGSGISCYEYPGKCAQWRITGPAHGIRSEFHSGLASLGVLHDKHIPKSYLMASKEDRLELLAGLLDTDGHLSKSGFDFIQKNESIAKDVVFLCRSLGLAAYASRQLKGIASIGFEDWYWRVSISGDCSIIPTKDPKKQSAPRRQKKNPLVTGITVEPIGSGDYYGFTLDGDKQFLLGDWQVTHNTEMGFEIIRGAQEKGKKVAFVANRVHLVDQTCRRLRRAGFDFGVIQGDNTKSPWSSVLVCSIQSIARRGMPDVDLIVVDEAHACAGTEAYRDIMHGKPVVGLTATPYSKGLGKHYDSLGGALFERVVIAARIEDLIRDKFLVSADIWAPSEPDLTGVKITAGDYNEKQLGEAVNKAHLVGDIVAHWFKIAHNTPTVVFATNISHSKNIVQQFRNAGVTAEHIDCYTDDEKRQAILERVTNGETIVLSNVGILAEGWDFPACKTLILARPTKSLIRYLQMAGRVLRPFEGKEKAIILDHSGSVRRLGFPWDYFGQTLDDGKPHKSAGEAKEKEESLPSPCPECSFMKPPRTPKCPTCGFETKRKSEVLSEDGDLVPLTKTTKGIKALEDIGRTHVYHQLLKISRDRGYKDGWASQKYKDAFGNWPNGISKETEEPCGVVLSWEHSQRIRWAKSRQSEQRSAA